MKQILLLMLFLTVSAIAGHAQNYKLSKDPPQFITDLKVMMAATKNEAALQTANAFEIAWNSGKISAGQKEQIIGIAQKMMKKKMRPQPQFEHFAGVIAGGVNEQQLTGSSLDQLLTVTDNTLDKEDVKSFERFLLTSNLFLNHKMLFASGYSRVHAMGGSFSFSYTESKPGAGADLGDSSQDSKKDALSQDDWGVWDKQAEPADDGWGTVADPKAKKADDPLKATPAPAYQPDPLPTVTGPALVLKNVDLVLVTPYDSVAIQQTEGLLPLASNLLWVGSKGTFGWSVREAPVKVTLKGYALDVSEAILQAEDATIDFPAMLEAPVAGVFAFESKKKNARGESGFPRFISFTNNAKVKGFGANFQYLGGFSLAGPKVMSAALDGSSSDLTVSLNGEKKFKSSAQRYEIGDSLVTSPRAAIVIYQQKDSITHPALQFKYAKPRQELTLVRDNGRFRNMPFYDSFHQMEITSEIVVWNLTTPLVNFGMLNAKDQIPARFESREYYTDARYQQLKGINSFHPLKMIVAYAQKQKSDGFYTGELAQDNKIKEAAVKASMGHLASEGYIDYDPASGYVKLRQKAKHYVSSSLDKKDYDHIVLNSVSSAGENATLNLSNNELLVRGIDRFYFSADSNSVYVKPDSGLVRVLNNRDLLFNGKVYSGNFIFKGKGFLFDYDEFYIDLAKIDSTIFTVKQTEKLQKGEKLPSDIALVNKKKSGSGKLFLNKPDNKSGKVKNIGYPKYNAESGAYVYFNKPEVLGGVYDTSVYFSIPPFSLDSLTTAKQSAIGFTGQFFSGGIFPPLETKLALMPDNSLGFEYEVPKNGLKAYGGKGTFYQNITLNAQGLRGKGEIKYLTTTLQADDFVFYLDSVTTAAGATARIEEAKTGDGAFPQASLDQYSLNWKVKADSMYLRTSAQPLKLYQDQYTFMGLAAVTPGGIYGNGKAESTDVLMQSPAFLFRQKEIKGSRVELAIKSNNPDKPALATKDVSLNLNMEKGMAEYVPEQESAALTGLPYSQYTTSLSAGKWDLKKKVVILYEPAGQSKQRAYLYSTHPEQDSLYFQASSVMYDLNRFALIADGVPHIAVADAYIIPDSNRVYIAENANMRTFRNASITMDTLQKFHQLYQGEIHVDSRNAFTGYALYDYKNAAAQVFPIKFGSFTPTETAVSKDEKPVAFTKSAGTVHEQTDFFIAPSIRYYGEVALSSNQQYLDFNGFVKVGLTETAASDWFPYGSTVNPEDVRIKIENPVAADGTPLTTGLHISLADASVYSTFISKKKDVEDLDIFLVNGLLSFDKAKRALKIGSEAKAYGDAYEGNMMYYNDSTSWLAYEGKFNLIESNKNFAMEASGAGMAQVDSSRFSLNSLMAFDINIPDKAWAAMGEKLAEHTSDAPDAVDGSSVLHYKLAGLIGDKGVQEYISKSAEGYMPLNKVSSKLERSLVLSEVDLRWSPQTNAWYSVGKIGLAGVSKTDINAKVDGYIEIKKGVQGDAVTMYLEAGPSVWYYLSYNENALALVSTDERFDEVIRSKSKGDNTATTDYTFYLGEPMERMQFVNYFRKTYLNLEPLKEAPVVTQIEAGGDFELAEESDGKKKKKRRKGKEVSEKEFSEIEYDEQDAGPLEGSGDEPQPEKKKGKKKKKDKKETEPDVVW